jgi:TonB-dependent receptor
MVSQSNPTVKIKIPMKTSVVRYLTLVATAAICLSTANGQLQTSATSTIPGSEPGKNDVVVMDRYSVLSSSIKESMITAQERKRERFEISDSIVADDINKLPDFSVTDALSRIPGIQVDREWGEGNGGISIRGIAQAESLLNGREIFSAEMNGGTSTRELTGGRTFNMSEMPAEMIAGIDIYKSSAANLIEGGLGGIIDVRLRRPFDFKGLEAVASVRGIYGDLIDEMKFQYSALVSNRFKVGRGELGVLVNFTYQERSFRQDIMDPGTPTTVIDMGGSIGNVIAPTGDSETVQYGSRERSGVNAVVQWAPFNGLEIYAEGTFSKFKTENNSYGTSFTINNATLDRSSIVLYPGDRHVAYARYTEGTMFSAWDAVRDLEEKHSLFAIGAKWNKDAFSLKADLSYTDATSILIQDLLNTGNNIGPAYTTKSIANYALDSRGKITATTVGTDLSDTSLYRIGQLGYLRRPYSSDMMALTVDGEYKLKHVFFTSVMAGTRYAKRNANNETGMRGWSFWDLDPQTQGAYENYPNYFVQFPDYFTSGNSGAAASRAVWHVDQRKARNNIRNLLDEFGFADESLPTGTNIVGRWDIDEEVMTGYVMAKFEVPRVFDGSVGVRFSRTEEAMHGGKSDGNVPPVLTPVTAKTSYEDFLPSLNTRWFLQDDFFLRLSISKTLTRPNFPDLAPALTLGPRQEESQNSGNSGNPNLRPIRSMNLDLSLEKYFSKSSSAYLALFHKDVDGYFSNTSTLETHPNPLHNNAPELFLISKKINQDNGMIKGFELGGQIFMDFLPGWLSGFGVHANYTYVDSSVEDSNFPGKKMPLAGLSEHSANLILMYEYKKFSARLAYNWRDDFYANVQARTDNSTNPATVVRYPAYIKGYGWLDASVGYSFNKRIRLSIDGTNLLNTIRQEYVDVEYRGVSRNINSNAWVNDVQFIASLTIRL